MSAQLALLLDVMKDRVSFRPVSFASGQACCHLFQGWGAYFATCHEKFQIRKWCASETELFVLKSGFTREWSMQTATSFDHPLLTSHSRSTPRSYVRCGCFTPPGRWRPRYGAGAGGWAGWRGGGPGGYGAVQKLSSSAELITWEQQALSARGFKRVGRHSEYAI